MATNKSRTILVFGTESGKLAVADIKMNFRFVCVFDLAGYITDISVLGDVFAVAAESGVITLFNGLSPTQHETIQAPKSIKSISIGGNWLLAACKDTSDIILWKV